MKNNFSARRPEEYDVVGARRFHELRPGDMFRARLANIRPGEVTIRFEDGKTHVARSLVMPDARIGEESVFRVRDNDFEGHIVLEMVKFTDELKQDNMLSELLRHTNLAATDETLFFGRTLLAAGMPAEPFTLTHPVLQRLVHCPCALCHATAKEVSDIARAVKRGSRYRTYHRLNRFSELHIFTHNHETTLILTTAAVALGRVEVTVKQKPGHPETRTYRTNRENTRLLLAQKGVHPSHVLPLDSPFTLLSPPPADARIPTDLMPKRFNFDMRV
jgi:hypothetical protein